MNAITVNSIIQSIDENEKSVCERVIWLTKETVITIQMFTDKTKFEHRDRLLLEQDISCDKIKIVEVEKICLSSDIIDKYKEYVDKVNTIVQSILSKETIPQIYLDSHFRGKIIDATMHKYSITKATSYKYLRRYLQNGMTEIGLIPCFQNCGAKGKERKDHGVKRGRPSKFSSSDTLDSYGININESIKSKMKAAIKNSLRSGIDLKDAYKQMCDNYFSSGFTSDGQPILLPWWKRPTYGQFIYWSTKFRNENPKLYEVNLHGERTYNLKKRPLLGDSTQEAYGPGAMFQIDASIGKVYLVSQYNRKIVIGKPVIYMVIDVYSRLIVGIYVGLEGPSWMGAMQALANTAMDKVKFCSEYQIDIKPEDWPCKHLPEIILADRGEVEGHGPDNLIRAFNIEVKNTAPYRADCKGIVERNFGLSKEKYIHWVPGEVIRDYKTRGVPDTRKDAALDLFDITQILISCVIEHNNTPLESRKRNVPMLQDELEPTPVNIWNWGIENVAGHLKYFPEDIVKLNLLPSKEASVTESGIYFHGGHYSCDRALREGWFIKGRKNRWQVPISYDPRNSNNIYLRIEGGKEYEVCTLLEKDNRLSRKTFEDIEILLALEEWERHANDDKKISNAHKRISKIKETVAKAVAEKKSIPSVIKVSNIRQNREIERSSLRLTQTWNLGISLEGAPRCVSSDDKLELTPSHLDTIKRIIQVKRDQNNE